MRISDWSSDVCSSDLGEEGRRARGPREQQGSARVLVEPVDELGAAFGIELKRVEQPVDMIVRLGAALRRQPRRLVDDDRLRLAVDQIGRASGGERVCQYV